MVLTEKTKNLGIDISDKEIDHVCYRCSTVREYQQVCDDLLAFGEILLNSMIGGRPIAMVALREPILFCHWSVRCIEVTCPKPGKVHQRGLEHAEVVIGTENDSIYNSKPQLEDFARQYPAIQFDEKAMHKEANADLSLTLVKGMSVKFHMRPVYEVISIEVETGHVVPIPDDYFEVALAEEARHSKAHTTTATPTLPNTLAGAKSTIIFPPPQDSDDAIAALLSDPVAMQHLVAMSLPRSGGWTVDAASARRQRQTTEFENGSSLNGAIYASGASKSEFAGIGGFRSIDWWNRSAEMGIILAPPFWRQGISVEVHYLCFVHAFEELCLNRIEFKTASSNTGMVKFCKDVLNANHDGTLRDAFPANDSSDPFKLYCDVELYSVLACEWPSLKAKLRKKLGL